VQQKNPLDLLAQALPQLKIVDMTPALCTHRAVAAVLPICVAALLGACSTFREPPEEAHRSAERESYETRERWINEYLGHASPRTETNAAAIGLISPPPPPTDLRWVSIGPQPAIFDTHYGLQTWSGRVNAIAIDPSHPNVMYLGSDGGGVWRSSDTGASWVPLSDFAQSLQISSIAIDPIEPNTIYAGTGRNQFSSVGILRSSNAGTDWDVLKIKFGIDKRVTSIGISPGDHRRVIAALDLRGIFRSPDSGDWTSQEWPLVLAAQSRWAFVAFHPTADVAYAAIGGPSISGAVSGIYKSTDRGATWGTTTSRPAFAAGSNPNCVGPLRPVDDLRLTHRHSSNTAQGLYRSPDGGQTWNSRPLPDFCGTACDFNHVLAVHPLNRDVVFLGGYGLWRSIDGGGTWTDVSANRSGPAAYLHVDQHALAFSRAGDRLYSGGDGGIWFTPVSTADYTAYEWSSLNSTLAITQFYSVATSTSLSNVSLGGTQDNNTQLYTGSQTWAAVKCGDGVGAAIAGTTRPVLLTTCMPVAPTTGIHIERSTDWGNTWASSVVGSGEPGGAASPVVVDPRAPDQVYTGTSRVYTSADSGATWRPISPALPLGTGYISAIGLLPSRPDSLYVGLSTGKFHVRTTAGWPDRSTALPPERISSIVVPRQRPDTAFIAFRPFTAANGSVWMTVNGGNSWTNLGLPTPPVDTGASASAVGLVLRDSLTFSLGGNRVGPNTIIDVIIAVTPYGVFQRNSDSAGSWQRLAAGLPLAELTGVAVHPGTGSIRVSTYGRGIWQLSQGFADVRAFAHIFAIDRATPDDRLVRVVLMNQGIATTNNVRLEVLAEPTPSSSNLQYHIEDAVLNGATCSSSISSSVARLRCQTASMSSGVTTALTLRVHKVTSALRPPVTNTRPTSSTQLRISGVAAGDAFDAVAANNAFDITLTWDE
jgi:hypothetical protein